MSLWPILWALKSAPVADAEERLILVTLAERAWADGSDALPSKKTIAKVAMIDPKTVQRRLRAMEKRGLIALGDQSAAAHIPEHFRPTVYDLMIPYSWFPDIEQANEERTRRGKSPLTPGDRPDLPDAPPRKQRADKGRRRKPVPQIEGGSTSPQGEDCESLGQSRQEGGTASPGGGVYKSGRGGLRDPQPSPTNPPRNTPRPSVPAEAAEGEDGGTDGAQLPRQISRNPGVDLLLAIGAEKPEFLLTGKTLQDQGLVVAGMLLEGWTPEQLRQVIAGRPLPDQITTTVGAIVSGRLKQALTGPVPQSRQQAWEPFTKRDVTPTPAAYTADTVLPHKHVGECEGDAGLCGYPTEPGKTFCRRHREELASL